MAKRKKRRKPRAPRTQRQIVHREQISITGEASYIISRAENYDARVVTLGPLIFFSTETGDAWMLDPEDGLALCLARGGDTQPFTITETTTNFSIEWEATYQIDGMATIYPDQNADPSDPASYDFAASDEVFAAILAGGFEPYLRLGDSWNNAPRFPAADPRRPTNPGNWTRAAVEVVRHSLPSVASSLA